MGKAAAVAVTAAPVRRGCSGGARRNWPCCCPLAAGVWIPAGGVGRPAGDSPAWMGGIGPAGRTGPGVWWSRCLKTVVLSVVTRLTSEVCRSAGEGRIASFVETAGDSAGAGGGLPLVRGVVEMMAEMLI